MRLIMLRISQEGEWKPIYDWLENTAPSKSLFTFDDHHDTVISFPLEAAGITADEADEFVRNLVDYLKTLIPENAKDKSIRAYMGSNYFIEAIAQPAPIPALIKKKNEWINEQAPREMNSYYDVRHIYTA